MVAALIMKITELFISIIAGFALVRSGVLKSSDSKVLSVLALYVLLPCTLFYAFQIEFTPQVRSGLLLSVFLAVVIHAFFILAVWLLKKLCGLNELEQVSVMYSNSANLIVPIIVSLYGAEYVIYNSGFFMVQMVLLWSHARSVISGEKQIQVKKIVLNPNIIAIILGLLTLLLRIPVPQVILNSTNSLGSMVGPLCMVVAGMLIADLKAEDIRRYTRLPFILFLRLIGLPFCVLVILHVLECLLPVDGLDMVYTIVFLAAIAPTASTITQFCQIYDNDAGYSNAITLSGTLLCIITMPIMLAVYLL